MDEDLGGNDVKVVSYTIYFTKREAEAVLQPERAEIIDYPTSAGAFAALKVADFQGRVQRDGIPWPSEWTKPPGDGYPEPGQPIKQIPMNDRKYLRLDFSVKDRRPRHETEANKTAIEAIRAIRDRLESRAGE